MMILQAGAVAAERLDDLGCVVVVFAENPDGSGERLELQRAIEFDPQDRSLGQDTYCVCLEGGQTAYGGIRTVHLAPDFLAIEFTRKTAEILGIDEDIRIQFETRAFDRLRETLAYVFSVERDRPVLVGLTETASVPSPPVK